MVIKQILYKKCSVEDCKSTTYSSGTIYCIMHYTRVRRYGDINITKRKSRTRLKKQCIIEDCSGPHCGLGYCANHYRRFKKYGDPLVIKYTGEGYTNSKGYRVLWINGKHKTEHTVIMEHKIGRKLLPNENVHHINGVKTDNRPENLELWVKSQPSGQRVKDIIKWAKEILDTYKDLLDDNECALLSGTMNGK